MELRLCKSNKEFSDKYQSILDANQEVTQIFAANLQGILTYDELPKVNCRGGIYNNDELVLLFLNANPHNLVLFSYKPNQQAIKMLIEYILKEDIEIKGILTNKEHCDIFIEEYKKIKDATFTLHTAIDIMRNEKLIKPNLTGKLVTATLTDLDFVINCAYDFHIECLRETPNLGELTETFKKRIQNNDVYIFINNQDEKTSMVMMSRRLKNGRAVTAVYTIPQYRGKGYATSMMYYATKIVFEEGFQYATLFVDKINPISNRVYNKVGYFAIANSYDYRLE